MKKLAARCLCVLGSPCSCTPRPPAPRRRGRRSRAPPRRTPLGCSRAAARPRSLWRYSPYGRPRSQQATAAPLTSLATRSRSRATPHWSGSVTAPSAATSTRERPTSSYARAPLGASRATSCPPSAARPKTPSAPRSAIDGDTALVGAPSHQVGDNTAQGAGVRLRALRRHLDSAGRRVDCERRRGPGHLGSTVGTRRRHRPDRGARPPGRQQRLPGRRLVFVRSGSAWSQQGGALTTPDGAADDYLRFRGRHRRRHRLVGAPATGSAATPTRAPPTSSCAPAALGASGAGR